MYSEMQYIIFKNDSVIAVCKYKEVADAYVKFLEEKETESQRKRREEGSLFWNYRSSFYVKSILNDNDILRIIEKDSSEKDGQENKVSSIFDEIEKSGTTICQKLEKE